MNNGCQTVYEPFKMMCGPDGQIRGIGKAIMNGKPTSGALMVKLRRSKRKRNEGSVSSVETKSGSSGSIAIATLTAGTHILVSGEVAIGPFTNLAKEAGRVMSGKKRVSITALRASTEEAAKAAKKGGKGGGEEGRGK